jgi:hypothetical protein
MLLLLALACRSTLSPSVQADGDPRKAYSKLLQEAVADDGTVDYELLRKRRKSLDRFVAWLATDEAHISKKAKQRHAYWLNAYNALVLYQVLERDTPASVLDVDGWLPQPGSGFFLETAFVVGGEELSLSEIEHERIRMMELDYRDHAAMNCASMSCPPLRNELYSTPELQGQLRDQMERWVADDARGVRIEGDVAVFNPIFDWFARDFLFTSAGMTICELGASYAVDDKRRALEKLADAGCPHRFFEYDWSLNQTPR